MDSMVTGIFGDPSKRFVRDSSINLSTPPKIVVKILMGALQACNTQDASRVSMSDIMHASNVSRGTLYKYFESKEQIISAVLEFLTLQFTAGLQQASDSQTDPILKFRAVLGWHDHFSSFDAPDRFILTEPEFVLRFLRDNFERHTAAMQKALTPCFDHFDIQRGGKLNREFICELLIRLQQSRLLMPSGDHWREAYAQSIADFETMLGTIPNHTK